MAESRLTERSGVRACVTQLQYTVVLTRSDVSLKARIKTALGKRTCSPFHPTPHSAHPLTC